MPAFEVCGSGLGVTDIGVSIRRRWWCVLPISVRGGICSLVPYGFAYSVQNLRSLPMPLDFSRHGLRTLPEVSNISPLPTGEGLAKEEGITLEGEVVEALPNARFKVKIGEGHTVLAHVSGKMRKFYIRILPGDEVTVEVSPYDLTRGRITYRER